MARAKGLSPATNDETPDLAAAFAALERTDRIYDALTRQEAPSDAPDRFGRVRVQGDTITFDAPVPLSEHDEYAADLWGHPGEVVFVEPTATRDDLRLLQKEAGLEFVSYARDEIVGRCRGIHLRWTPDDGAEIIAPTGQRDAFDDLLTGTWLSTSDPSAPAALPVPVLARLGAPEAGVVSARHAGEPIATPYFSGVFDHWTRDERDTVESGDVTGYGQFMAYAEDHAEQIIVDPDAVYALLDGLMVGFIGEQNDHLAVSVTGAFAPNVEAYLQDWLPKSRLTLTQSADVSLSETALVRDKGFEVARPSEERPDPGRKLVRPGEGVTCIYRDGTVTAGARLVWTQIAAERVRRVIDRIDAAIDELSGA
jgi:hypothetical protein